LILHEILRLAGLIRPSHSALTFSEFANGPTSFWTLPRFRYPGLYKDWPERSLTPRAIQL